MKIINKIAIIGLSAVVGLTGCKKDFLDKKPTDQVATEDVFKDIIGAESALQGIHRIMYEQGGDHDIFGYPSLSLMWDLMGDDMPVSGIGAGWFIGAYRHNDARDPGGPGAYTWSYFFRIIHNANMILANIDNIQADQNRKDYVKASAQFYRAFCYYNLAVCYMHSYDVTADLPAPINYSGPMRNAPCVPIYLAPTKEGNARATVGEVYDRITTDLEAAIALFEGSNIGRTDKSEIDISVAKGLYARVALTMQDWATAETMAIEARQGYSYMSGNQLFDGFTDAKNPEWIWGSIINQEQNGIYASFLSQMDYSLNGYAALGQQKLISSKLFNAALDTSLHDARRAWWVGRYEKLAFPEKYTNLRPLSQLKFKGQSTASFIGDFPLMRAGEMALIEAEAKAQQNKVAASAQVLNDFIRTRRPGFNATTANSLDLVDTIRIQRRIELWGEGFRYADLKREFATFSRARQNATGLDRATAGGHSPGIAVLMTLTPTDPRWNFRIPGSELNNNNKMIQNP